MVQSQRIAELMVQDGLLVLQPSQSQSERLHLQFIARHIVPECHALLLLGLDILDKPLGECDVLLVDLHAVLNLEQIQILPQGHEALGIRGAPLPRYRHVAL